MKRVYQKRELDAMAAKFTRAAPEEVKKRFKVPISGTLTCAFAGVAKPGAQELIVYDTQVVFEWRLRSPHVQGVISQALEAHRAMRMLSGHFVPFGMKRPLVAAHLYKKLCGRQRPLPAMKAPAVAETKVRIYAIAMAKQITEPLRKTILKRRGGARLRVCLPTQAAARFSTSTSKGCVPWWTMRTGSRRSTRQPTPGPSTFPPTSPRTTRGLGAAFETSWRMPTSERRSFGLAPRTAPSTSDVRCPASMFAPSRGMRERSLTTQWSSSSGPRAKVPVLSTTPRL